MKKLRFALCGCRGKVEKFGNLINSFEESEVVAAWDGSDSTRCKQIAETLGCAAEMDYDRLLSEYNLDAVVIWAENALHKELIVKAANAGVNVFVEKPLCLSAADAREIQTTIRQNGVKFFMSDPFVHQGTLKLKELIDQGVLGSITGAHFHLGTGNALSGHVNYRREMTQGGIMADVGGHMVHKAHFLFGKPESLSANFAYLTEQGKVNGIEENAVVVMRYPGDMLVTMECSWVSGAEFNAEEIYGTKGVAVVTPYGNVKGEELVTVKLGRDKTQTYCGDDLPANPTQHIRYFVEMLAKDLDNAVVGRDPLSNSGVSIDNAVEFVEILEVVYQSARQDLREIPVGGGEPA